MTPRRTTMPIKEIRKRNKDGKIRVVGYQYGDHGKLYTVARYGKKGARAKAARQGRAIQVSKAKRQVSS